MARYRLPLAAAAVLLAAGLGAAWALRASLPDNGGARRLPGLSAPAEAVWDGKGIPRLSAKTREDAFQVLGFVTARDRLFQMDLMRRHAGGRLAEILGEGLVEADRFHRVMGLETVARAVLARLPENQRAVLAAYAAGVNQALAELPVLPPECLLLGYRPEPWRPEDSLLVVLGMHENLGWKGDMERTATVLEAALSPAARTFFMPPMDRYTHALMQGEGVPYQPLAVPRDALAAALKQAGGQAQAVRVADAGLAGGSNAWVVGPGKTRDGRALLANDMHLALNAPNIWYRAELRYPGGELSGFTLPGVPLLIAGSNGRVAWGFTSIDGDHADLVSLEVDPADPGRYRTPAGYARFGQRRETIQVRGGPAQTVEVATTVWGPVLERPLLGRRVAARWTALDPESTDLTFLDLDRVATVDEALSLFNRAGSPPLNALAADASGNIGWTYAGRIPRRYGLDGAVSQSWADGKRGWDGYVPPEAFPRRVNPPSGFIVNANQRMVDGRYPYPLGSFFENGYRAYRIGERLGPMQNLTERDLLDVQLDSRTEFYRYYQQLALSLLESGTGPAGLDLQRQLARWDGRAETESLGFAVLAEFRKLLLGRVLGAYLAACRGLEPDFSFEGYAADEPLRQILHEKPPELLPDGKRHADWDGFLRTLLLEAAGNVSQRYPKAPAEGVAWGRANRVSIAHPFSAGFPALRDWLDMPAEPLPGCDHCVRWSGEGGGATERLVVSPGHEIEGIFEMPTGQSGHPLSAHYRDQQADWVEGKAAPFLAGPPRQRMAFLPAGGGRP
jgi:penicillin amidase